MLRQITLRAKITHATFYLLTFNVKGDYPSYLDCYDSGGALVGESTFSVPGLSSVPSNTIKVVPQYPGGYSGGGIII